MFLILRQTSPGSTGLASDSGQEFSEVLHMKWNSGVGCLSAWEFDIDDMKETVIHNLNQYGGFSFFFLFNNISES